MTKKIFVLISIISVSNNLVAQSISWPVEDGMYSDITSTFGPRILTNGGNHYDFHYAIDQKGL